MPLPSPYRNPGRWRAVVFQREVRHGTAGCLLSLVLLAPLLVRTWGLGRVVAAVLLYSCLLVPALTNYFSASRLLLRLLRSVQHVVSPPRKVIGGGKKEENSSAKLLGGRRYHNGQSSSKETVQLVYPAGGGGGREAMPGAPWLILLVLAPYLLYLLRARPFLLLPVVLFYVGVVLPIALRPQLPQGSLLGLPRALLALFTRRSTFYAGLTASLGSAVSRAAQWAGAFVRQVLRCLLKAITMPFIFIFSCVVPVLHAVYLAFDGFRITSNQVVFFLMMQQLVTPVAHLTALYFLLFYTVLHYIHKALFSRQWVRLVETTRLREDVARLTAWYVAARLGKGVAMSFVLVMFTLQFNHVEPDLLYMAVTFLYFVITQRKWTGNERIVSFIRALRLDLLEEEEEFWVPLLLRGVPLAASACTAALLAAASCPRLVVVAAYTNLLVPGQLLRQEYVTHATRHTVLTTKCNRATPQEASSHSPCPVCLEDLRQARVTPCGHYYHVACLRRCLLMSPLCPLCKQVI